MRHPGSITRTSKVCMRLISYSMMSHLQVYQKVIEQGQDGQLNEYLLFLNQKVDDQNLKIETTTYETSG
jgi:hypothetical protein